MGTYNKGILGPFRGKVGSVIGYSWRGKDLMRGLPKESTSEATDAQLEQRAKFRTVIKFLTPAPARLHRVVFHYFYITQFLLSQNTEKPKGSNRPFSSA